MKKKRYICSVKRMKMVISSVGMLMLSAQFAFPPSFLRQISVVTSLFSLTFSAWKACQTDDRREMDEQPTERSKERGKRTEIRETIQGKQVKGSNSKSEGILMNGSFQSPMAHPRRILYLRGRLPP